MRWLLRAAAVAGLAAVCALFVLGYGGRQGRSVVSNARSLATHGRELVVGGPAVGSREGVKRCLSKHGATSIPGPVTMVGATIRNGLAMRLPDQDVAEIDVEQSAGAAREAAGEIDRAELAVNRAKFGPVGSVQADALSREMFKLHQRVVRNVVVEWLTGLGPKAGSERIVANCVKTGR
jgi:hypothetical protein